MGCNGICHSLVKWCSLLLSTDAHLVSMTHGWRRVTLINSSLLCYILASVVGISCGCPVLITLKSPNTSDLMIQNRVWIEIAVLLDLRQLSFTGRPWRPETAVAKPLLRHICDHDASLDQQRPQQLELGLLATVWAHAKRSIQGHLRWKLSAPKKSELRCSWHEKNLTFTTSEGNQHDIQL